MTEAADPESLFLAELGQRVRTMRALRGMSRKVLSRVSGVSERYIAQLESGQGNASVMLLRRLAHGMGAKLEDLTAVEDNAPDWAVIRDLLKDASEAQIAQAKAVLAGRTGGVGTEETQASARVALVGLRGAGKSTLGRIAAERLGWRFVELNREIERDTALSVPEIFALYGQEGYRRLEQAALRRLVEEPGPLVLATGGGVVAEPLTFELLLSSFFTVWLKARPEEHMRRVREQGDLRPMGDDRSAMQELRAILASREPLYARAGAVVDTAGLSVDDAADRLVAVLEHRLPPPPALAAASRAD